MSQKGCTSFAKIVSSAQQSVAATNEPDTELCFTLTSGEHHPDTRAFDDSTFVVGMIRSLLSHDRTRPEHALSWNVAWAGLRVTAVRYWSGSFAHGIPLRYQLGGFQVWGPEHRRSEERRVGKEGFSACRTGWRPYH